MEKRRLGRSRLFVSPVIFGAWGIGGPPFWKARDRNESIKAIKTAIDLGINTIDTAPVYGFGLSEEMVGEAVSGRRDEVVIATKLGLRWKNKSLKDLYHDLSPESVAEEVENSLARLKTDRIDLYQIHWPDPKTPVETTMEALLRLREQGKILEIGVSNFGEDLLKTAITAAPELCCVQPKYNILERDIEKDILPLSRDRKLGVIVYSPLASGALSGKYGADSRFDDWRGRGKMGLFRKEAWPEAAKRIEVLKTMAEKHGIRLSRLAIKWVLRQPGVTAAIVGANSAEQIEDNVKALELEIPEELLASVQSV